VHLPSLAGLDDFDDGQCRLGRWFAHADPLDQFATRGSLKDSFGVPHERFFRLTLKSLSEDGYLSGKRLEAAYLLVFRSENELGNSWQI
jgi:hypothetical protein